MSLPTRAWHAVRHDFGRKVTALVLALGVWFVLDNLVLADLPPSLSEVRIKVMPSVEAADLDRAQSSRPFVYIIVPDTLIVERFQPEKLTLNVKGLKQDVEGLVLFAYVPLTEADLDGLDENPVPCTLNRESFKSRGEPPNLTQFHIGHETTANLLVTIARRSTVNLALGAANVQVTGQPLKGFTVDATHAAVTPNVLDVSGPRKVIERFRLDAGALKLAPVSVEGRSGTVTQFVGLADTPDTRYVTLGPPGLQGQVQVQATVPVVSESDDRELRAIRVHYFDEDTLKARHLKLADPLPDKIDVVVHGPKSELAAYTPEQLAQRVYLIFDFNSPDLVPNINQLHVDGWVKGLSDAVKVFGVDKRDEAPLIQFKLEAAPETP